MAGEAIKALILPPFHPKALGKVNNLPDEVVKAEKAFFAMLQSGSE